MAQPKRPPGRPPLISPAVRAAFVSAVEAGNYLETAAALAGIAKPTLYKWMKRGARERPGAYAEFVDAVKKAMAVAESRDLETIRLAAATQWTAAAWRLERRFPERWSRDRDAIRELSKSVKELQARDATRSDATGSPPAPTVPDSAVPETR